MAYIKKILYSCQGKVVRRGCFNYCWCSMEACWEQVWSVLETSMENVLVTSTEKVLETSIENALDKSTEKVLETKTENVLETSTANVLETSTAKFEPVKTVAIDNTKDMTEKTEAKLTVMDPGQNLTTEEQE